MPLHTYTRRTVLASLFRAAASATVGMPTLNALAQSFGGPNQRRGGMMQFTEPFRRQYRVPAMSIALSKNGQFVYDHAGGMIDREHTKQASRIAYFASLTSRK